MNQPGRQVIRLANDIQDQLLALRQKQVLDWSECVRYSVPRLEQLLRLQRRLGLCRNRKFHAASRQLKVQSVNLLPDLVCEIEGLQRIAKRPQAIVPSLRELVAEIHQAQQEFDGYDYTPRNHTLSIRTDPIELAGIELGPFRIDLHLPQLACLDSGRDVYAIEALEPHPAATDSGIVHPHVSHGRLCEGDAAAAIRAALQEGRICDFFLVVRSVLGTYNGHSPYVSLENWQSQPCHDCGYGMNEDSRYYCESCENDYCEECISYCRRCDRSMCKGCLTECPHCQELYCERCMDNCSQCRQPCCPSCLEDDLCPTCKEEQERREREEEQEQSITADGSAPGA